jgi:hypothetical protein
MRSGLYLTGLTAMLTGVFMVVGAIWLLGDRLRGMRIAYFAIGVLMACGGMLSIFGVSGLASTDRWMITGGWFAGVITFIFVVLIMFELVDDRIEGGLAVMALFASIACGMTDLYVQQHQSWAAVGALAFTVVTLFFGGITLLALLAPRHAAKRMSKLIAKQRKADLTDDSRTAEGGN